MTWDELRAWCLSMPGAEETFPFEPGAAVFKAANGKMFAVSVTPPSRSTSASSDPSSGRRCAATSRPSPRATTSTAPLDHDHPQRRRPDARVKELVEDSYELVRPRA